MKTCTKCGVEKDEKCFSRHKSCRGGLRPYCKACVKITSAAYYSRNKDTINKKTKKYWRDNKGTLNAWQKQYFLEHKEEKHHYYVNNKENISAKRREYENNKLKTDVSFRLRRLVASAIRGFIKKVGGSKGGRSISKYLPYTMGELKSHLDSLFEPWMNWDNHGKYDPKTWDDGNSATWTWQIDHIVPQSLFNYTSMDDDDFKRCWALENLRPLPSKQNLLDGITRIRHRK